MTEVEDVIDVPLVRRLVAAQFPEWAHLPIERVEPNGWDNRTFRLGSELSVRMPSHEGYVPQVEKEQRWLPRLGPLLPLPLHELDPTGGPAPGPHNFFRGGAPEVYDTETQDAIEALERSPWSQTGSPCQVASNAASHTSVAAWGFT